MFKSKLIIFIVCTASK